MNEHLVRLYQDSGELAEAVAEYVGEGLQGGEAVVVIATAAHRAALLERIGRGRRNLKVLDAERTLGRFMVDGMPQWEQFRRVVGGLIAELQKGHPAVRAYGEMVDLLWQRGEYDAAVRLEEYWNELARVKPFSLLCAYRIDPLDGASYRGTLECLCRTHARLMPARDAGRFDEAVAAAMRKVLADDPLGPTVLALAARYRPPTQMPAGQATLFWLHHNMPRAAAKILSELRAAASPAG